MWTSLTRKMSLSTAVTAAQLKAINLSMNEAKTEFTNVYLSETHETGEDDEPLRGKEEWRKRKTLGSLLCSSADIAARCIVGNIAFQSFKKLCIMGRRSPWQRSSRCTLRSVYP